jgi:CRP-like cAMP-binding protein
VPAGARVITLGEPGDRFYVIETGRVEVTVAGRVVRIEGPGESFGEIALLRDIPRTATVTALDDTVLLALERDAFLEAVTGQPASHAAAASMVEERLAVR